MNVWVETQEVSADHLSLSELRPSVVVTHFQFLYANDLRIIRLHNYVHNCNIWPNLSTSLSQT